MNARRRKNYFKNVSQQLPPSSGKRRIKWNTVTALGHVRLQSALKYRSPNEEILRRNASRIFNFQVPANAAADCRKWNFEQQQS